MHVHDKMEDFRKRKTLERNLGTFKSELWYAFNEGDLINSLDFFSLHFLS